MIQRKRRFQETVLRLTEEFHQVFPREPATWEEQSLSDRLRRSLSWLERATSVPQADKPPRFVNLWIGLNALYGVTTYKRGRKSDKRERDDFRNFMGKLKRLDGDSQELLKLSNKNEISEIARLLMKDHHLWKDFWANDLNEYAKNSKKDRKSIARSCKANDVVGFFSCIFDRLNVLRNQIFHGSSSATTRKSKKALEPAIRFLEAILPAFISLMVRQGSGKDWPDVPYPGRGTPQYKALKQPGNDGVRQWS